MTFCLDVLFEVFQFGDRCRLTKLERVARRFPHFVEKWFGKMPFLRLDIRLQPGIEIVLNDFSFSEGFVAFIGSEQKKISLPNLATFPPFVCFNEVTLNYDKGSQSLLAKCRLFEDCLNSIKSALKDSNKMYFFADINQADPCHFSDHSSLVIYIRDKLLPIYGLSRRCVFDILFKSDKNSVTELISSILQISQIRLYSNVELSGVSAKKSGYNVPVRLPIEDISNWLTPKTDEGVEICGKTKLENRFLRIFLRNISNTKELWDHLKEVVFRHS